MDEQPFLTPNGFEGPGVERINQAVSAAAGTGRRVVIPRRSPFGQTMNAGIVNDTVGYVATDQAPDQGNYETRLCRHVRAPKGTGKLWADTAVAGLESLNNDWDGADAPPACERGG